MRPSLIRYSPLRRWQCCQINDTSLSQYPQPPHNLLAQFVHRRVILVANRGIGIASQLHGRYPGMPIRCRQRSQMCRRLVILVHFLCPTASIFPHLCPQKEMLHRRFDHVEAIEHLIDIFRANVLLRAQSLCFGRRDCSGIASNLKNKLRSARSGRLTTSSMLFKITGRLASNKTSSPFV